MTDYGLDGPGIESRWGEIFCLSRPALEPTQPPVQWVPGLSQVVKGGRGVLLTTHPLLVPRPWKSRAILLPTLLGHNWACNGITLPLLSSYCCAVVGIIIVKFDIYCVRPWVGKIFQKVYVPPQNFWHHKRDMKLRTENPQF